MRLNKDIYLIRLDDSIERLPIMSSRGESLVLDMDFNPKEYRRQYGEVIGLPIRVGMEYINDNPLKEGDKVLVSHLISERDHSLGDNLHRCEYFNIFAKVNNWILEPLEDFIFCDRMVEKRSSVLEMKEVVSMKFCVVVSVSNKAKEYGIREGDIVHFTHNSDYGINISGKKFTRIRLRNVICIERDGELFPVKHKMKVKVIREKKEVAGIEVVGSKKVLQKEGIVIDSNGVKGFREGDKICYYNGHFSRIDYDGIEWSFIEENNVHFKYN